jgi:hypothetical protein
MEIDISSYPELLSKYMKKIPECLPVFRKLSRFPFPYDLLDNQVGRGAWPMMARDFHATPCNQLQLPTDHLRAYQELFLVKHSRLN